VVVLDARAQGSHRHARLLTAVVNHAAIEDGNIHAGLANVLRRSPEVTR